MGIHISHVRRIKPVERMDTSASNNTVFELLDSNPMLEEDPVMISNGDSAMHAIEWSESKDHALIGQDAPSTPMGREFGCQTEGETPFESIEDLQNTIETLQSQFQALMMDNTSLDKENRQMKEELDMLKRQRNVGCIDVGMVSQSR
jgi:hypothetical protein